MKKLIYALIFLAVANVANAQVTQQWVSRYNGTGNSDDNTQSLAVDGSGNVYVTGYSTGNATVYDYATIKYNSAGVQQWVSRYNGPGNNNDIAYSIAVDGQGNVYVTGSSYGSGTNYDYATIKYNSAGVQQWVARYNGTGENIEDAAYSLAVDGLGNVYVTGSSWGIGTYHDYATIKYDSAGVVQWVARYNGPGNYHDMALYLAVDGPGNVYVTGWSTGSGILVDYATIKYNSEGVQQWVARYNGPGNGNDYPNSLAVDNLGNVYVTGQCIDSTGTNDYATIKYNSTGVQQWVARYNGTGNGNDIAYSIAVDGQGNVYVTGSSTGNATIYDYATIKYNSEGVQQWVARYNGPGNGNDDAQSLAVDGSGNVYVTGDSYGIGTDADYATIKYNSSGVEQWVTRYNGPLTGDAAYSLVVDGSGNVYVTGDSYGIGTDYDYATIKYSQDVGIKKISTEIPASYSLGQNYPNPFNPSTIIRFQIPSVGQRLAFDVRLKVYDILGKEVATLVNEKLQPGTYEASFDGSNLTSGVYFYRLTAGDFSETKRMMLIK